MNEVEQKDPKRDQEPSLSDEADALMAKVQNDFDDIGCGLAVGDSAEPTDDYLAQLTNFFRDALATHDEPKDDRRNDQGDKPQKRGDEEFSGRIPRDHEKNERKHRHGEFGEDVPNA
ncbi:unannotated protein [freshwater metagenome]|uniref:Unannotated protein n=1 Tax=freshwater metagenome TaxID=449393 RepID=A0A6J7VK16_9ZZZZ